MILVEYSVRPSLITGAGKGFFVQQRIDSGRVIIAPANIAKTYTWPEVMQMKEKVRDSSVVWFENHYVVDPEWQDECYINHSFTPNALPHLGFIFALQNLEPGTELTLDYRLLLKENEAMEFLGSDPRRFGLPWVDKMRLSLKLLDSLFA